MSKLTNIKLHWTHKVKIKKLYRDGFSDEEIAIMYKIPWSEIKRIVIGQKRPERI